jgi:hypothetical protein
MKRSWTITLLKHEQPDAGVWAELVRLTGAWNRGGTRKFEPVMDFMWHINFDAASRAELDTLLAQLETLKRERGAAFHLASRNTLEEEDYAAADFIEILGTDLGSPDRPFVRNQEAAFAPGAPCPVCGAQDAFDVEQREPLAIDLSLLESGTAADGTPAPAGGWDLVNVVNGDKIVSARVVSLLEAEGVRGYALRAVMDGSTGRPTERAFQIAAERAVLTPCPEHSRVEGEPFCPACGTAYGALDGYFWVRSDQVDGVEVVSRHPRKGAMLYVSRRVYERLRDAGMNGLQRNDVLRVCAHG